MIDQDQFANENRNTWLQPIVAIFNEKGRGGEDFLYLLETMLQDENISFIHFLEKASNGMGCVIHQGLSYSLDQDWENPALFDEVAFYVGYIETACLPIKDYLTLLSAATNAFIASQPENSELASRYLSATIERYENLINGK